MKKLFLAIVLVALSITTLFAQQKRDKSVFKGLSLTWEIVENNYNNKPQSLSVLTLVTNKSGLPAQGWKLYFNFAEPIPQTLTTGINIMHVNGDLFCLSPTTDFKGISPHDSLKVQMVSADWVTNITDAPDGCYLVWDKFPTQDSPVTITAKPTNSAKQYNRSPLDKVPLNTPQVVYEQNKNIRDIPADSLVKIFPTPESYQQNDEQFRLDAGISVLTDPLFTTEANNLKKEFAKLLMPGLHAVKAYHQIKLVKKPMPVEAYELLVDKNNITISASSGAGIFYGIQSLKTLIPAHAWQHPQKAILIPGVRVIDKPRFGYRAVMLDVARNFQPKGEILKLLDVMALYKLNVLHFHLTDDEGWRLQIPTLPELTSVGAKRGFTLDNKQYLQSAVGSGPFINTLPGSGFYTVADFIEILKYATARHISVIPEIESPGHARAAIKAMDARYARLSRQGKQQEAVKYLLHDLKDTSKYTSVQYYNDNVIDVSLPSTYNFIATVTRDIEKMYRKAGAPLKTIHYGGDEVPAGAWEKSPSVLKLMQTDTSVKTVDDLWVYYYQQLNTMLKARHLYLTAWEEVGSQKVIQNGKKVSIIGPALAGKNVHLEVWNNVLGWGSEDLAYKLANRGYKVILSCVTNLYFDMAYNKAFDEPGYYWGGYADIDRSFSFIPYNYFKNTDRGRMGESLISSAFAGKETLTATGIANIVGLQGALWGETLKTPQKMEYMLLPKLLGLAERAWAKNPNWANETDTTKSKALYNEAWSRFVNVLGKHELPRLENYYNGYNYRIPNAGAVSLNGQVFANVQLPGFTIRYTTNGEEPTVKSAVYTSPITVKGLIKLAVFSSDGRAGKTVSVQNN